MTATIQIKRSNVAGKIPGAAALEVGELAVNFADKKIYTKEPGGTVIELGENVHRVITANDAVAGLRITQTGTGDALRVEDEANPDATPFVVDASGNVGIGTATPAEKLVVAGSEVIDANNAKTALIVSQKGTGDLIHVNAVQTDGTIDQVIVDKRGYTGIGTTPAYKLHIASKDAGKYELACLQQTGAGAYGLLQFKNAGTGTVDFGVTDGGSNAAIIRINGSEKMRIAADGNVGIGVAAPSQKLEVAGVIKSGATGVNGSVSVSRKSDGAITAGVSWDDVRNAMVLNSAVGDMIFEIGSFERARLDARFNFLLTSTGCLGYGTGSGGTVTQTTSKSTDMALNRSNGQLVLNASSIPANGAVSFMVVNNLVADTDMIHITIKSGSGSVGGYVFTTAVGTGAFIVAIRNLSGSPLAEALVLNFAIFKGVTA